MNIQNKNKRYTVITFAWLMSIMSMVMVLFSTNVTANAASSYDFEVTKQTSDFYVNDFANLFTEEQKAELMKKAIELNDSYGEIQVVITTVDSLADCAIDGKNHGVAETSYAMYKQYEVGKDDMGILILFSVGDREIWMQTGYKMQTYITDSKAGTLQDDYAMDYFRNDQFAEGLIALQDATISEIKKVVPQDWDTPVVSKTEEKSETTAVAGSNNAIKSDDNSKKDGIGGWFYAILVGFVGMLASLGVAIKSLFSSKSRATAQKEASDKAIKEQKSDYEGRIASLKRNSEMSERKAVAENSEYWQRTLEREKNVYETKLSDAIKDIEIKTVEADELRNEISKLAKELNKTQNELADYRDKYARIQKLHPDMDFENEVHEMIENEFKAKAKEVDEKLAQYADVPADKDNISVLMEAINIYDTTEPEVQKYLETKDTKFRILYEHSVSLKREYDRQEKEKRDKAKAQDAFEKISAICKGITVGTHENYDALINACNIYNHLGADVEKYFPDNELIEKISLLRSSAEADKKDFDSAKNAENEVHRIVDRIYSADEDDVDNLERAMRYYRNLSSVQQSYFSHELARKLKQMLEEAEEDHRRKEEERRRKKREEEERKRRREEEERRRRREEEERRRRMSSSSSFSSSSHSSFGGHSGHGGRPSGGGAGRHF